MSSKQDKLFDRMKSIKKNVAYDRSKKITKSSDPIKEKLDESSDEITILRRKLIELEQDIKSKSSKINSLNTSLVNINKELITYKADKTNIVNQCTIALTYYAAGKHFEEGTFKTKVLDRGEIAQEVLDIILKEGN